MRLSEQWTAGLVEHAGLDETRLGRGRTALRKGQVGAIEVEPGLLRAVVDSTSEATTIVGVSPLAESVWVELMESATSQAALSAALLAGEVPEVFVDALVPGKGEVSCDCSCADGLEPCLHAASLLHAAGDLFDIEPFALLLVRGRGRNDVLTELRARRARTLGVDQHEGADHPRGIDHGVPAADAWRTDPALLDTWPRLARNPGSLVTLAAPPPSDSGIDERELRLVVEDAAARALDLLSGGESTGLELSVSQDVVRRAARGDVAAISEATKVPVDELASAAQAWQFGGAAGLRVSRRSWEPEVGEMQAGVGALGSTAKLRGNKVSLGPSQLRLDEDGRWWLFHADDALGWVLASEAASNPNELV